MMTEEVIELLLKRDPELIDGVDSKGYNVLHSWVETRSISFYMNLIPGIIPDARAKVFGDYIHPTTLLGRYNPLHLAAMERSSIGIVHCLINGYVAYQKEINRGVMPMTTSLHPWTAKDRKGNMPVHLALEGERHHHEEFVLYLLSLDSSAWVAPNSEGDTPLFIAASNGYGKVIDAFVRDKHRPQYLHIPLGKDGVTDD
ncbi:Rabankyrin-5 [Bienertia sinuspersici]